MTFNQSLHNAIALIALPPHVAIKKAVGLARRKYESFFVRRRDVRHSTHTKTIWSRPGELHTYFRTVPVDLLRSDARQIKALAAHSLAHRFDLLGSGWVQVKHGMQCRGLEGWLYKMGFPVQADPQGRWLHGRINSSNLEQSQRIWQLVDQAYTPIDWHLDFKSGYRWSEASWYLDIHYGHKLGVDIKVPWELARMQHLPQLGLAHALAVDGVSEFAPPEMYAKEFANQVLDFIATNPPRFGVNWTSTMDVAIRVANWLVTYDLFNAFGAQFDPEFKKVFVRSVYDHGLHIVNNLEWSEELTGNHYLADIVGLLFVAAYLDGSSEVDTWLAFAVQELVKEVSKQFYEDGANFEASTSYHRLSAEMVAYATALVLGLPENKQSALRRYDYLLHKVRPRLAPAPISVHRPTGAEHLTPFPYWYLHRLEKMAEFTMDITKPNGHIPQIGDNDSGRFLKLQPAYHKMTVAEAKARYVNLEGYSDLTDDAIYWDEDHLDHRHLVAEINGLFERADFTRFSHDHSFETLIVGAYATGTRFPSYHQSDGQPSAQLVRVGTEEDLARLNAKLTALPEESRNIREIPVPGRDLREGLTLYAYPDFGLYLYCSDRLYLAVRCGPIGQNDNGGHAHNDQLNIELCLDGKDVTLDPGTYVYTPLPRRRNAFRSTRAHFTPQRVNKEMNDWPLGLRGLFQLKHQTKATCLYFQQSGFAGMHLGFHSPVYRLICFTARAIEITDIGGDGSSQPFRPLPLYSSGYGLLLRI